MFEFLKLNRVITIPINNKKDIEFLLAKKPLSEKRTESINTGLTFFKEETKVKFLDKEVRIICKLKLNIALLIPFASLLIIITLLFQITDCSWFKSNHFAMLLIAIFTNYLMLIFLIDSAHSKIKSHIFSNMYYYNFKEVSENEK